MKSNSRADTDLRKRLLPIVEEQVMVIAERLGSIIVATTPIHRAAKSPKPKRKSPTVLPVMVIGGIDPKRTYSVPEFLAITRMSRQALSRARRAEGGLIVRDCGGSPQIIGQD